MKPLSLLLLSLYALAVPLAHAQAEDLPPPEIPDPAQGLPEGPLPEGPDAEFGIADDPPLPPDDPAGVGEGAGRPFAPLEDQKREMEESSDGYIIRDAALNDIFQFLAKSAGRQYFHNMRITGPEYTVTGHLNDGNPLQQMEELAFQYGLTLHTKGTTIYALNQTQLSQLPSAEFHYQLRYLRPTDMDQIKELIRPMLTPSTGIVNFEPKTNTIIIIDTAHRIEQARNLLHNIDRPKGQIIVETKILRVNSTAAERVGVNWADSLSSQGVPLVVARDLSSVFGLPPSPLMAAVPAAPNANLVLNPVQLSGVLRALAAGGLASQVSNPTLITEDNEQATISIIDRIPIITSTTTPSTTGQPTISEEVRYRIDESDQAITDSPENHREIGISLVVTPTLLPDGTVRMQIRPRSAQITGEVIGRSPAPGIAGNVYPRVTESMVEALARVPDGHSLVVGGFYGEIQSRDKTKVPLFGDVPVLNFFFKSRDSLKEQTSLVFIVTPTSYNPASALETRRHSDAIRQRTSLSADHHWVDETNPGPAHEPNLARSLRGLQPQQAPYYPTHEELNPPPPAPKRPVRTEPRFGRGHRR